MNRLFFYLLVGFTFLIQGCDDEKTCGAYRLITQVDVQNRDGGDATFIYNTDGSLQKVSGRYNRDDNFFYDAKGRVISMYQDTPYIDSTVFVYDDSDKMIKTLFYRANPEIFYYYDIEYPDAGIVKKSVYFQDPDTKEFGLGYVDTYTLDNHPRPHPQEYYLYQFPIEEVFLQHNPLSIHTTYDGGKMITKSFSYNQDGYPVSEDDAFIYVYSCK